MLGRDVQSFLTSTPPGLNISKHLITITLSIGVFNNVEISVLLY